MEKKRLETDLKESEIKYKELFEKASDAIYTLDKEGHFVSVNNAALNILHCESEDIIGSHVSKWLTLESRKLAEEDFREHFSGKPTKSKVREIICKNGEHKWVEINSRVLSQNERITGIQGMARDITEKVILEGKLRESEAQYRDLFENAKDPIYTIDIKGFFLTINDAGCTVLKAEKEDIIGTQISKWLTPQSMESAKQRIKRHASKATVEEPVVYELVCKDGQHRFAEIRTRDITKNGIIIGIHGMGRDITDKRILIDKLKESEAKYRHLFENADDPMYTHDEKGFFQTINKAGLLQLGCSEKEVIGTHISKWLTPENYKKVGERFRKILAGEPLEQPEIIEVVTSNGEHRWGEARISLIKKGKNIIGIQGVARDITEKIILEQQLKESESRYRDLFENAQVPMFILDMNGNFIKMNKSGLIIIGCKEEELNGSPLSKWITAESFNVYQERIAARLSGKSIKPSELIEVICKNGEHRLVEINTRAIKEGNKIIEIHGIARDVTEKKRLEEKLREYHEKLQRSYEELMESDRAKTEFVSNITHELLTPLTSIKGFVELLGEETIGTINPEQKRALI